MRDAIAMHLDDLREDGQPIPEPTAVASLIFPAA
jgi:predicted RNase H-like HicB family nuclease